jgi:imidazolonepropionase
VEIVSPAARCCKQPASHSHFQAAGYITLDGISGTIDKVDPMDLIIRNATQLIAVAQNGERVKCGRDMRDLAVFNNGAIIVRDNRIHWIGYSAALPPVSSENVVIDATGMIVMPGLIDCHTHLVFAGSRADEFEQRIAGRTYQEIAANGGGISATVRRVRAATKEELKQQTRKRLEFMLRQGVTTVEIKSGYGLSLEDEIKCLEAVAELKAGQGYDVVPTFLGAHEVPPEFRNDRSAYIQLVAESMIPEVSRRGLAEFCDVFCEQNVFTVAESERILQVGLAHGLRPKIHADEFSALGGAELAGRLRAISADHLLQITDAGIEALRQSGTIATLLPGTAFFLGLPYAPARKLIERGLPVALATDCNPGSCMSENLLLIGSIACTQMKMLPAEAITALTLNAAAAVGRSDRLGSLEIGKLADLVIFDVPRYQELFYHFGVSHVWGVVKAGRLVVAAGADVRGDPLSPR